MSLAMKEETPVFLRDLLFRVATETVSRIEEIRIRLGKPVEVLLAGRSRWLTNDGQLSEKEQGAWIADAPFCRELLQRLTKHSVYSFEEQLRQGFVTAAGGHRVGLSGQVVLEHGKVKVLRDVTSFNIRLARERKDLSRRLLHWIYDRASQMFHHTLIVSAPQHGKTTLLRDLARVASNGFRLPDGTEVSGQKVGIVDERSELAGCVRGVPQFDVGLRTDVLDQCPKVEGLTMMIRSMSPHVVVVDEIGREEDAVALYDAMLAGIRVFASAHAHHITELMNRPIFQKMKMTQRFSRLVMMQRQKGTHLLYKIYDGNGRLLTTMLDEWR